MASVEALIHSRKRGRAEDGEEDAEAATQVLSQRSKELYLAMKAACTAKRFSEAVGLCTEALNEEQLSKANRTKFLLARSSIYSQMEDSFPMAIKDAKQAILLSPTHAMGYLRAAKAFHQEGHKAKATQALAKAASLATDTISELGIYIRELQREWNVPHIQALPNEVLAHAFGYLGLADVMSCTLTCRRWKDVTMSSSDLWRYNPILLRGTLKQVDAKWRMFYRLSRGGHISSLKIDLTPDAKSSSSDLLKVWQGTLLRKTFPSNTLIDFEYLGRDYSMDEQIWSHVTMCSKLKVLRWKSRKPSRERDREKGRNFVRWQIEGTPLADCRLEVFHCDDPTTVVVDEAFTRIFSKVKRLTLMIYLPWYRQFQILTEARKTVQEVFIPGTISDYRAYEKIEQIDSDMEADVKANHAPIVMEEITTFGTLWDFYRDGPEINQSICTRFAMPKLTTAILKGGLMFWSVLLPWQESLLHLYFSFERLHHEIQPYRLPNCESLKLLFTASNDLTTIWQRMKLEDETQRMLPKLKHLTIAGHPTLQGADLISLVRFRMKVGTPLIALHVYQSEQVGHEAVAWLRRTVPDFIYSTSLSGRDLLEDL